MNSAIVACPAWLTPSPRSTFHTVRTMIFRSSPTDPWSTYHRSWAKRARAHQAEVAAQHVHELRELVDAAAADELRRSCGKSTGRPMVSRIAAAAPAITGQVTASPPAAATTSMPRLSTSTAMGRFFLTVMAGAAELERNLVCERTKLGMAAKRANGELVGGVPFGHRLAKDGVTLQPHATEKKILTRMRRMRARGMSLRSITDKLNADKVPARGKRWHLTTVANLLRRTAH